MLIRPLFNKYQDLLLSFANTNFGKDYLGVKYKDLPVTLVAPDGIHQALDEQHGIATFYSRSPYLKKLDRSLRSLAIIEESGYKLSRWFDKRDWLIPNYQDLILPQRWLPKLSFFEKVYEPDAHPETSTVDGSVYIQEGSTNWSTVRNNTSGSVQDDLASDQTGNRSHCMTNFNHSGGDPDRYSVGRGYFCFDTRTLNHNHLLETAIFSLYNDRCDNGIGPTQYIVVATPTSYNALIPADYDQGHFGGILSSVTFATLDATEDTYRNHSITTNVIELGGITGLGTRTHLDTNDVAPSVSNNMAFTLFAENGTNIPYLTVTYKIRGSAFLKSLL